MTRSRQFDPESALDEAMQLFWLEGYGATSIETLARHTGLSRSSLYATFASKDELFWRAMQRYDRCYRRSKLEEIECGRRGLAAIDALFQFWVRRAIQEADSRGCLLANTAIEFPHANPRIRDFVAGTQKETEAFFGRCVRQARAAGETAAGINARDAARSLLAALLGMLVLIRTRPEPALLRTVARQAVASVAA